MEINAHSMRRLGHMLVAESSPFVPSEPSVVVLSGSQAIPLKSYSVLAVTIAALRGPS